MDQAPAMLNQNQTFAINETLDDQFDSYHDLWPRAGYLLRLTLCYPLEMVSITFLVFYAFDLILSHSKCKRSVEKHAYDSLATRALTFKKYLTTINLAVCFSELCGHVCISILNPPTDFIFLLFILVRLLALSVIACYHYRLRSPIQERPGRILIPLFWLSSFVTLLIYRLFFTIPLANFSLDSASIEWHFMACKGCKSVPSVYLLQNRPILYSFLDDWLKTFYLILAFLHLSLSFVANFRPPSTSRASAETSATFFSRLFFIWFDSTIYRGWRQQLTREHIFVPCDFERIGRPVDRLERLLSAPSVMFNGGASIDSRPPQLRLIMTLVSLYKWQFARIVFIKILPTMLVFLSPVFLGNVISFIRQDALKSEPLWHGYLYVGLMFSASSVEAILNSLGDFHINRLALLVRSCLMATIYDRLVDTRRRWSETHRFPVGSILNIMSLDTQRVMDLLKLINLVWICPLQVGIAIWLLWSHLGYGSLGGLAVLLFILLPFNTFVGARMRSLQKHVLTFKDQRVKRMSEAFTSMMAVKLCAWEEFFMRRILRWREREMKILRKQAVYSSFITFAFNSALFFIALASFSLYTFLYPSKRLDAGKIFVSMSIFNVIRRPLAFFPQLITTGMMFLVSIKRIADFLELETFCLSSSLQYSSSEPRDTLRSLIIGHLPLKPRISLRNCTFRWPTWLGRQAEQLSSNDFLLSNITLELDHPQLVTIIGEVGAGKSSLLASLFGQMTREVTSGEEFIVEGRLSHASQAVWIQNASIRENILFGTPYDAQRYRRTLSACALLDDLSQLQEGDQTMVGDKGASLSGGQKQRISIARAAYREADIYLLDDPLSALDAQVSKHIFEQVLGPSGLLAGKIRLLVTSKYQLLPKSDKIILLSRGQIKACGSYEELTAQQESENEFVQFLASWLVASSQTSSEMPSSDSETLSTENDDEVAEEDDDSDDKALKELAVRLEERFSSLTGRRSRVHKCLDKKRKTISLESKSTAKKRAKKSKKAKLENADSSSEMEAREGGTSLWVIGYRYTRYIGLFLLLAIFTFMTLGHILIVITNFWLSDWNNNKQHLNNTTTEDDSFHRLSVYALLGVSQTLCILVATWLLSLGCLRASAHLHTEALSTVFHAPITFFELTPLGRVLNRLTKDVDMADVTLIASIRLFILELFRTLASIYIICASTSSFVVLVVFAPLIFLYAAIYKFYIRASRELVRLEAMLRTPIYSLFSESYAGLAVLHAFESVDRFRAYARAAIDENTSVSLMSIAATRWLNIRLELLGDLVVLITAWFCIIYHESITPGKAGLAIYSALTMTSTLNLLIRASTEVENNLVSIERLLGYTQLEQETHWHSKPERSEPESDKKSEICPARSLSRAWLQSGDIKFSKYSARYRPSLELCLRDIDVHIPHGTRVGIVGRTGAGKSSFVNALSRLVEPETGAIFIDNVNIVELGLHDLRSAITIIPQDPFIFTGTLRENLDPLSEFGDEMLIESLRNVHLDELAKELDATLDETQIQSLSSGKRQLLCLARALLRQSKVLVFDEAMATIDPGTIELIQKTIDQFFTNRTLLTIVHQLNTVINYDAILVLSHGQLVEFDSPKKLLADKESYFSQMLKLGA